MDLDWDHVDKEIAKWKKYREMPVVEYNRLLAEIIDGACSELSEEDSYKALAPAFNQLWRVLGARIISRVELPKPEVKQETGDGELSILSDAVRHKKGE